MLEAWAMVALAGIPMELVMVELKIVDWPMKVPSVMVTGAGFRPYWGRRFRPGR